MIPMYSADIDLILSSSSCCCSQHVMHQCQLVTFQKNTLKYPASFYLIIRNILMTCVSLQVNLNLSACSPLYMFSLNFGHTAPSGGKLPPQRNRNFE